MSNQGLRHAAMTAASIATFLAVDHSKASAHHDWNDDNHQQPLAVAGERQRVSEGTLLPMARRGLPQKALKVGQTVRLMSYSHRRNAKTLWVKRLTLGDRTVALR